MGKIEILSPGLFSTIQDNGRYGFREHGIPVSGYMDKISAFLCNTILENPDGSPLIEITITGPKLLFHDPAVISITGADITPSISSKPIKMNAIQKVNSGEVLYFGHVNYGCRSYLGIHGNFNISLDLDSASTYEPVELGTSVLRKASILEFNARDTEYSRTNSTIKPNMTLFKDSAIEVYAGPEFGLLNPNYLNNEFRIENESNRMGYRLHCKQPIPHQDSILTSVVMPGTVQLPPNGQPVILMRDCQTTGGYPRVLQLTELSINKLAQKKPGDLIKFKLVEYP